MINTGEVQKLQQNEHCVATSSAFEEILRNFEHIVKCTKCGQILKDPKLSQMTMHMKACIKQEENLQSSHHQIVSTFPNPQPEYEGALKIIYSEQKRIQNPPYLHISEKLDPELEKQCTEILSFGKLSCGSKKQFKGPIVQFLYWLRNQGQRIPTAADLEKYISETTLSLQTLAALERIAVANHLVFSPAQLQLKKEARKIAQEQRNENPNRAWKFEIIQAFMNDLMINGFKLQAFRIYILFELAAQISELSQITFKMLQNGEVNYIPKKQLNRGEEARREIQVSEEIQQTASRFMEEFNISPEQTLNLGKTKSKISESALQLQLEKVKSFLSDQKDQKSFEYFDFLQNFTYHDLRYSRIQSLSDSGLTLGALSEFLQHSNTKLTKKYLKSIQKNKFNTNGQIIMQKTEVKKLQFIDYGVEIQDIKRRA